MKNSFSGIVDPLIDFLERAVRRLIVRTKLTGRIDSIALISLVGAGFGTFGLVGLLGSAALHAQEFAALVTPPRYELQIEPGKTTRQVLEISHLGGQTTSYRTYTADWTFAKDGTVSFYEPLQAGSCRPWVSLERREITLASKGKTRFRFEIAVPPDAVAGECRFAVMIEGRDQTVKASDAVSFPMAARIGVIVYATIGKGAPVLEVVGSIVETIEGKATPVLQIQNTGNAHGRLSGILDATDSLGAKFELSPSTLPIMPNETRKITLTAPPEDKIAASAKFPLTVKGTLEWVDKKTTLNQTFTLPPSEPAVVPRAAKTQSPAQSSGLPQTEPPAQPPAKPTESLPPTLKPVGTAPNRAQ